MHLFSSYHIFTNHLPPISESDKVVFIDFGCGPLTSGIAFWAFAGKCDITYIGIDNSQGMLDKAWEINQYGFHDEFIVPFYKNENFHLIRYCNHLPQLLNSIEMHNSDDTLIIFNFSYFLQSNTFNDPSNIEKLGDSLLSTLVYNHGGNKIYMVYQDPVRSEFQGRWYNLKSWIITYHSMFDVGFTWQDPTKVACVKYDTLWGEQNMVDVSHDSFNNLGRLRDLRADYPSR